MTSQKPTEDASVTMKCRMLNLLQTYIQCCKPVMRWITFN